MMRFPHPPEQSLFQFLRSALQIHLRFISGALPRAEAPIYVIGNPSADLDSIVSALVYSYFANNRVPQDQPRPHVPLINLANVPSGSELRRLRPEFAKALWLSTQTSAENDNPWKNASEPLGESILRDHLITVADFESHLKRAISANADRRLGTDAVLVDWNALPMRSTNGQQGQGSIPGLPAVDFTILGCIDHHVDESFLPSIAPTQPHLVEPAGSCTSLVIRTLDKMRLWEASVEPASQNTELSYSSTIREEQVAKLAMAAILIDTANLTAKDKVTDFDTAAYNFLLSKINLSHAPSTHPFTWDRNKFYAEIQTTKQNSLDLLTVDEMLDRDYKEWTEKPSSSSSLSSPSSPSSSSSPLQIGICSMVKSIPWIVRKAGSPQSFLKSLEAFAAERELDIVIVMTAFSSPVKEGQFCRELLICAPKQNHAVNALEAFISESGSQLGLEEWSPLDGDGHTLGIKELLHDKQDDPCWRRIWVQKNVAKSRKQVAPLIRGAVASL